MGREIHPLIAVYRQVARGVDSPNQMALQMRLLEMKESASNHLPQNHGPTECNAIGIFTALPTPLNFARGSAHCAPQGRAISFRVIRTASTFLNFG